MISWVRIDRAIGDDPKVHRLAEALGADVATVVGYLVFVFGHMAEQAKDGDLREVPDTALERWAGWTGRRGRFAAAFRTLLTTDGVVSAWTKHNGAAIEKAEADAQRKRVARDKQRAPGGVTSNGTARAESAPRRGTSGVDVDVDETNYKNSNNPPQAADAAAPGGAGGTTWLTPYDAAWRAAYPGGEMPHRPSAKALRELETAHGAPEVQRRWRNMLAQKPASVASAALLKKAWPQFATDARPAPADDLAARIQAEREEHERSLFVAGASL